MTEISLSTYVQDGRLTIFAPKTKATRQRWLTNKLLFAFDCIKRADCGRTAEERFLFAHYSACSFVETALLLKGYRLTRVGDIDTVIDVMPLVMGKKYDGFARYFYLCKQNRKRDRYGLYGSAPGVTFAEADRLLHHVKFFEMHALIWLIKNGWWEVMR